jgi:tRNA 2-thiouridine synthesizing protein E
MPTSLVVDSKVIQLDKDGYLTKLEDWSPEVAEQLAANIGLQLNAEHWEILQILRLFYQRRGLSPVMRIFVKLIELELGPNKGNSLYLLKLFPESPARVATLLAGLPRPVNCV